MIGKLQELVVKRELWRREFTNERVKLRVWLKRFGEDCGRSYNFDHPCDGEE